MTPYEHFKGTKAITRGNGDNRIRCLHEVSGLEPFSKAVFGEFWVKWLHVKYKAIRSDHRLYNSINYFIHTSQSAYNVPLYAALTIEPGLWNLLLVRVERVGYRVYDSLSYVGKHYSLYHLRNELI